MDIYTKPSLDDFLMHYGVDHYKGNPGSGRYPWGSGGSPFQHSGDFLSRLRALEKSRPTFTENRKYDKDGNPRPDYGVTYTGEQAVAKILGMELDNDNFNTSELRLARTLAKNLEKMDKINRAEALLAEGYGYSEIARKMGLPNESSARSLLEPARKQNILVAQETADFLKARLEEKMKDDPKAMLDIGKDVERDLGITGNKLKDAIYILEGEGYTTFGGRMPNVTDPSGAHQTTMNVLTKDDPDITWQDFYDYSHFVTVKDYISKDGGETYQKKFQYPESMDSSRLMIRYAEDGGKEKDGIIELRRGVEDLSLGESNYAQVRILVDGDRYIKGMAVYNHDNKMPDGVDVIFNTNKHKDVPMTEVLKKIKDDPDNPFGSLIKDAEQGGQYTYTGKDGKEHLGLINKRSDEGDWNKWKDELSAQFLSKQPVQLAKRQLGLAIKDKQQELDDILSLENNTIKKYYLDSFANDCDSAAVHLKAAALPKQKFKVIIPIPSMKDNEIFAPGYEDGTELALIRYPHGGKFEIPFLKVNNKIKDPMAKSIGKDSTDAVGINAHVAGILSGADFDGDTVMVIPTKIDNIKIKNNQNRPLKGLENFEPKDVYGCDASKTYKDAKGNEHYFNKYGVEFKHMKNTQTEMGVISNLITDMTIAGAPEDELARAVRHSMVVIDAEKHHLDYKSSEVQNGIKALKKKYQSHLNEEGREVQGASTLISMAKSEKDVPRRKGQPRVNIKGNADYDPNKPEGALLYKTDPKAFYTVEKTNKRTGETYTVEKFRTTKSTKMAETDDAYSLVSKYQSKIELVYADYANTMKALANKARKLSYDTKGVDYSPSAAKTYAKEVEDLNRQLDIAHKNSPKERQAQAIATGIIKAKQQDNPKMTKDETKKVRQQAITKARSMVGAERKKVVIDDKAWAAIQAGALRANKLNDILNYTDTDKLREYATPKARKTMTSAMIQRAQSYRDAGRTNAEIAAALGVSTSTIAKALSGKQE